MKDGRFRARGACASSKHRWALDDSLGLKGLRCARCGAFSLTKKGLTTAGSEIVELGGVAEVANDAKKTTA